MEVALMLSGLTLAVALLGLSKVVSLPRLIQDWKAFQAWRAEQAIAATKVELAAPKTPPTTYDVDPTTLKDAAFALAHPPTNINAGITWLRTHAQNERYAFPVGWHQAQGKASLCYGAFIRDTNHILVSGTSDVGKDNLALNILFTLALTHRPEQLQIAVIDGKGLDFTGWKDRAHTWRIASRPEDIKVTMEALSAERERRRNILEVAEASKWENYRGNDLPLLVVYISELSLLEDATSPRELTQWLNSELAAGRAFGIRYIIATQTVSNFSTRWRSQIGLYIAGFQPSQSQDEPNTGLSTKEIKAVDAVPPSELPPPPIGAGVFTAVHGRACLTIRASYIDDNQRRVWLQRLPVRESKVASSLATSLEAPQVALPVAPIATEAPATNASSALECPKSALPDATKDVVNSAQMSNISTFEDVVAHSPEAPNIDIPVEERTRILELAAAGYSRRKVCEQVYGVTGGRGYERVKAVLDNQMSQGQLTQAA